MIVKLRNYDEVYELANLYFSFDSLLLFVQLKKKIIINEIFL